MTAYLVLASPGAQIPDERSVVIADRFAPVALLVPVFWLLFNRLWLEALAAVLVIAAAAMLTGAGQPALGLALNMALSLLTALEGRNWRAAALQRRGWQLADVVEADDADMAFEIHAVRAMADINKVAAPRPSRRPPVLGRQGGTHSDSIGLVPVERN